MKNSYSDQILLVDDDLTALALYETILRKAGYENISVSTDGREVRNRLENDSVKLILLDINLPGINGIQVLEQIIEEYPEMPVIMITSQDDIETAVRCMKIGAYDYLIKPTDPTRLITAVKHALELYSLKNELSDMGKRVLNPESLEKPEAFEEIVTVSDTMISIFQYLEAVAPTNRPVLITGESGTGKELLARALHKASGRKGPLVTVNAAGLDDSLFSDTLFGHKKGAFTDAGSDRPGLVEKAAGGTLFLDEIGDLAPASQVKLLRLLQEKEYYPLGSDDPLTTDARIVAATSINLQSKIEEGRFRKDLFFRLIAHQVSLPPLRERKEDLMILVKSFLSEAASELKKSVPKIPPELKPLLEIYDFPGNIRELQSLVFDALSRTGGNVLNIAPFRDKIGNHDYYIEPENKDVSDEIVLDYDGFTRIFGHFPTEKEVSDLLLKAALEKAEGNQSLAAKMLGLNQSTLSRRISKDT